VQPIVPVRIVESLKNLPGVLLVHPLVFEEDVKGSCVERSFGFIHPGS
jgi:hypothetical protein